MSKKKMIILGAILLVIACLIFGFFVLEKDNAITTNTNEHNTNNTINDTTDNVIDNTITNTVDNTTVSTEENTTVFKESTEGQTMEKTENNTNNQNTSTNNNSNNANNQTNNNSNISNNNSNNKNHNTSNNNSNNTSKEQEETNNLLVEAPTLSTPAGGPGFAQLSIVYEGIYKYEYEGPNLKPRHPQLDGYELYEKKGNEYKLIHTSETEFVKDVTVDVGETRTFVARVYTYNKSKVKIYSNYSNEIVI